MTQTTQPCSKDYNK